MAVVTAVGAVGGGVAVAGGAGAVAVGGRVEGSVAGFVDRAGDVRAVDSGWSGPQAATTDADATRTTTSATAAPADRGDPADLMARDS